MTQQSNKDWIDKAVKEICMDVKRYSDTRYINLEDTGSVVREIIEKNQPDYETKIRELIKRRTNIKERNMHPINPVYFLEDLQSLLHTPTDETKDL